MWTEGLRELGNDVTVLQPSDFEFMSFVKKGTQLRSAIGILFAVRKILKNNHYDIIEFYGYQYWLLLLWIKTRRKKIKTLFVAHVDGIELHDMEKGLKYYNRRKGLKKWIYINTHYRFAKMTFELADRYVCGCRDDLDYVIDRKIFAENHASCISPGIDEMFHQKPFIKEKEKTIVFLGTWSARKGVVNIPKIITNILNQHPDYTFHVYGAWSAKDEIHSLFPANLRDRVIVFDKLPLDELHRQLEQSRILFFPSYSEGFGLATVEAMSCSCAVVTTRTGVGAQLIDNQDALLVDFEDSKGMTNALNKLITDDDFRISIAFKGYLRAKEFQWKKQLTSLDDIYNRWLKDIRTKPPYI